MKSCCELAYFWDGQWNQWSTCQRWQIHNNLWWWHGYIGCVFGQSYGQSGSRSDRLAIVAMLGSRSLNLYANTSCYNLVQNFWYLTSVMQVLSSLHSKPQALSELVQNLKIHDVNNSLLDAVVHSPPAKREILWSIAINIHEDTCKADDTRYQHLFSIFDRKMLWN